MADLRVNIAGVQFKNPVITASGTFGFGQEYARLYDISKLGGISCKGTTLHERPGNLPPRIAETPSGILNSVGLQNPGVDAFLKDDLPALSGAVFMSQFLDCFSRKQILKILNKVAKFSDRDTRIFILEPFIDKQQFEGAAYALSHISMYFTCMANGNSKMYNESDMKEIIAQSDLKLEKAYQNIGKYDYTLLECVKK